MSVVFLNYPDVKQHEGVVTAAIGQDIFRACLVSGIAELCNELTDLYRSVPEAERPVLSLYWHPKDFARVVQPAAANSLALPKFH